MRSVFWLGLLALTVIPCGAVEPTDYYNHVVFDNSITPDYYYYSSGRSVFPSTIQLLSGALPVEHKNFFTAPNALRLQWRSVPEGSWEAEVRVVSGALPEMNAMQRPGLKGMNGSSRETAQWKSELHPPFGGNIAGEPVELDRRGEIVVVVFQLNEG